MFYRLTQRPLAYLWTVISLLYVLATECFSCDVNVA